MNDAKYFKYTTTISLFLQALWTVILQRLIALDLKIYSIRRIALREAGTSQQSCVPNWAHSLKSPVHDRTIALRGPLIKPLSCWETPTSRIAAVSYFPARARLTNNARKTEQNAMLVKIRTAGAKNESQTVLRSFYNDQKKFEPMKFKKWISITNGPMNATVHHSKDSTEGFKEGAQLGPLTLPRNFNNKNYSMPRKVISHLCNSSIAVTKRNAVYLQRRFYLHIFA